MPEYREWPMGAQKEPCPRCADDGSPVRWRGMELNKSGVCLYERADRRDDDVLICLDCGCLFYRSGAMVHPHGLDDDHLGQLLDGTQ
jgi:hypothetical protein